MEIKMTPKLQELEKSVYGLTVEEMDKKTMTKISGELSISARYWLTGYHNERDFYFLMRKEEGSTVNFIRMSIKEAAYIKIYLDELFEIAD